MCDVCGGFFCLLIFSFQRLRGWFDAFFLAGILIGFVGVLGFGVLGFFGVFEEVGFVLVSLFCFVYGSDLLCYPHIQLLIVNQLVNSWNKQGIYLRCTQQKGHSQAMFLHLKEKPFSVNVASRVE